MKKTNLSYFLLLLSLLCIPIINAHDTTKLMERFKVLNSVENATIGMRQVGNNVLPVMQIADADEPIELRGCMIYSSLWDVSEDGKFGIYSMPAAAPLELSPLAINTKFNVSAATYVDGMYCAYRVASYNGQILGITYYVWDADSWELQSETNLVTSYANYASSAMAYDKSTGTIYGQFLTEDGSGVRLCTIDKLTGTPQQVAVLDMEGVFYTFSFTADGILYGIADDGNLYNINKETGSLTLVGATGINPVYSQSATIDMNSGRMFWAALDGQLNATLREVDLTSGESTLIGTFPGTMEFLGLYAIPTVNDKAPGAVKDLRVEYDEPGGFDCAIKFTAPQYAYDGSSLSGPLDIEMYIDYEKVNLASSTINAGEEFAYEHTFLDGLHNIQVILANEAGEGERTKIFTWAGIDIPEKVSNLNFTLDGNVATVSWEEPTTGVNGGYFDASLLKYKVTRFPGNVVLHEGTTETSITDVLPDVMGNYYYQVVAIAEKEGELAESNKIMYGPAFEVPYMESFDSSDALDIYTAIDFNKDENNWQWEDEAASNESDDGVSGDWLITPPIHLTSDWLYKFSFNTKGYGTFYHENLTAAFGKGNTIADMTNQLGEFTASGDEYILNECVVEVKEDGEYYFGIQHANSTMSYKLYVDDISVEKYISTSAPDSVYNYVLSADNAGGLKVSLSFNAPEKTINGEVLGSIEKIEIYKGEQLIKTETTAVPGGEYSYVFDAVQGVNEFNVIVYGEQGRGRDAKKNVFVGVDIPSNVRNLRAVWGESDDWSTNVIWDAPSEIGVNGGAIDVSTLTYSYASYIFGMWIDMATGITDTNYLLTSTPAQVQTYVSGAIRAVSAGGAGEYSLFGIMLGTPLSTPFVESFADGSVSTQTWSVGALAGSNGWAMYRDATPLSQDGDNGYAMCLNNEGSTVESRLETPIMDISSLENPCLVFYYLNSDNNAELSVEVTADGSLFEQEAVMTANVGEWTEYSLPLDKYKGAKRIQIGFRAKVEPGAFVAIDNVKVQTVSSVNGIFAEGKVYASNGNIVVDGFAGIPVNVYTIDGMCIKAVANASGNEVINVDNDGIYIVKIGEYIEKVIVRR